MKKLNLLPLAVLFSSGIVLSSCEKESESIAPVAATSQSADAKPTTVAGFQGDMAPCPIGAVWNQGPAATGLSNFVGMRLVKVQITGVGEIDTYKTDNPATYNASTYASQALAYPSFNWGYAAPMAAPTAVINNTIVYDQNNYVNLNGARIPVSQKCVTTVDLDGSVIMKVTVNLKQQ